jgi:hypothetical protein
VGCLKPKTESASHTTGQIWIQISQNTSTNEQAVKKEERAEISKPLYLYTEPNQRVHIGLFGPLDTSNEK